MADEQLSARALAFDVLEAVLASRVALEAAFDDAVKHHALDSRDRAFARNLVATTLRRQGQIRALIDHCLERPLPRAAKGVGNILGLGLCQLLFLNTPAHAAVDTSVALAAARGHGPHKSLINAVLRRLAGEGPSLVAAQDAARLNTPAWLWNSWEHAYGDATCRAIATAHLCEPPLDLTVKDDPSGWAAKLGARLLPNGTLRLGHAGIVSELDGFAEGAWWIQDAAASLPARLLGDVAKKTVFDLCAAPGGKTAQLANAGARVVAVDRSDKRLVRLAENLERLGLTATMTVADAATWRPAEPADAVLLDAPCTATGTIRRHPDVPYVKKPEDIARMAAVQERLLAATVGMVRPGGALVYCTCSLQPEEGPERIARFLEGGAPFVRVPITPAECGGVADAVTGDGDIRTLPCHLSGEGGLDGFFVARLRRL